MRKGERKEIQRRSKALMQQYNDIIEEIDQEME